MKFRDDELDMDDPEIIEEIERQEKMQEIGEEFRFGKLTAIIKDDIDFEFKKSKDGSLTVKASGYHDIPTEETTECDMGHRHPIIQKKKFVYRSVLLSKRQRLAFAKWLISK